MAARRADIKDPTYHVDVRVNLSELSTDQHAGQRMFYSLFFF